MSERTFTIIRDIRVNRDGTPFPASSYDAFGPFQNWLSENCSEAFDVTIKATGEGSYVLDTLTGKSSQAMLTHRLTVTFDSLDDLVLTKLRWS